MNDTLDSRDKANARTVANLCRKYIANGPDDLEGAIAATERMYVEKIRHLEDALAKAKQRGSEADELAKANALIGSAVSLALRYGQIEGDHHRCWVIDQMLRVLLCESYAETIAEARRGDDGPYTYDWDVGIAP